MSAGRATVETHTAESHTVETRTAESHTVETRTDESRAAATEFGVTQTQGTAGEVATHARVVAENNDCGWCGGSLVGETVESDDGRLEVSVTCEECGHDYV
jgi:DNA-directed RNA polymerase subunit M/transcription elongation factor TFIIS